MICSDTGVCFAEGVRLFNIGNFFEAHELWESEWKKAVGLEKTFYQGLIQAAAALLHVKRNNRAGAASLYLKSWPKLSQFPDEWMGIELGQLRADLTRYFAWIEKASNDPPATTEVQTPPTPVIKWSRGKL